MDTGGGRIERRIAATINKCMEIFKIITSICNLKFNFNQNLAYYADLECVMDRFTILNKFQNFKTIKWRKSDQLSVRPLQWAIRVFSASMTFFGRKPIDAFEMFWAATQIVFCSKQTRHDLHLFSVRYTVGTTTGECILIMMHTHPPLTQIWCISTTVLPIH